MKSLRCRIGLHDLDFPDSMLRDWFANGESDLVVIYKCSRCPFTKAVRYQKTMFSYKKFTEEITV